MRDFSKIKKQKNSIDWVRTSDLPGMSAIFDFLLKQKFNKINTFQDMKLLQKDQNCIPITHRLHTDFGFFIHFALDHSSII